MTTEPPSEQPTSELSLRQVDLPLLYANWVRLVPGPFEFALDLGYSGPGTPQQPALRVLMTWEHAKILQGALDGVIEQREANVGEIKVPPGIVVVAQSPSEGEEEP